MHVLTGNLGYKDWQNAWNQEKAAYCCRVAGRGCPLLLG